MIEKGHQAWWQASAQTAGKQPVALRGIGYMRDSLFVVALSPSCNPKSFLCISRKKQQAELGPWWCPSLHQSQHFLCFRAVLSPSACSPDLRQDSAAGLGVNGTWMCLHQPVSPTTLWHNADTEVFNHYFWLLSLP